MDSGLIWLAIGLGLMGYFIGEGLKNFQNPKGDVSGYPYLIKEKDLHYYLGLTREETKEMLSKYHDRTKRNDVLSIPALAGMDVVPRVLQKTVMEKAQPLKVALFCFGLSAAEKPRSLGIL